MSELTKLLDKAREACSRPSDMALAAALGVQRQSVSEWRAGKTKPTDKHLAQLVEIARVDPCVLVQVRRELADTAPEQRVWDALCARLLPIMSSAARAVRVALGARA